jgi:probable rRNA maturation factor
MPDRKAQAVRLVVQTTLGRGLKRAEIERRLRRMMTALRLGDAELSVLLTGDDQIQELNRVYRKKNRPTDVLAFAMSEGGGPRTPRGAPRLLGDVIVSVPTARAQAKQARRAALDEVTMLLAHGLLHLLGWDHDTPAKDRAMRSRVDRLCEAARIRAKNGRDVLNGPTRTRAN